MNLIAAAASLLLGLASAERLTGAPFAYEAPSGSGVVRRESRLEGAPSADFTLQDWGKNQPWLDMIRVQYFDHYRDVDSGEAYASGFIQKGMAPWGKPERRRRAGFGVTEAGYRTPDKSAVWMYEVVQFGRARFLMVSLSCRGETFKQYAPVYQRLKESIVLDDEHESR